MRRYAETYIGGSFRLNTSVLRMPVVTPVTGRQIAEVCCSSAREVEAAVQSAAAAFEHWSVSSLAERRAALQRLRDALAARADEAAVLLAEEMGCPVWLGRLMQLPMPLKGLDLTIEALDQLVWEERIGNGLVERVASGVVVAITPWNFPLHQIVAKVAAAIAAGCTVVLKPSEIAPGAAHLFMQAVHAAGLPPGVVNSVWGGPEIGEQLVRHPLVSRISFTGSTGVGRKIMMAAASDLKPVTLELGGKSAAVLLDDADLETALPSVVRLSLANSGQACVSQSRLIVPANRLSQVLEHWRAAVAQWPIGNPLDDSTRLGPVATRAQYERVLAMTVRASQQGAQRHESGEAAHALPAQGYYVPPIAFTGVRPDMEIAQEEVFGPVLAIMTYETEEEAQVLANSTRYGLSGAVWSADPERAVTFARRLKTGQVVINGAAQNLATPFGGWGWSGFGRENGRFGIEDLLNYRALHGAV